MFLVYVLLWTPKEHCPFPAFSSIDAFYNANCSFTNCYVTDDRTYFGSDFGRFDAVVFNGGDLYNFDFSPIQNRSRRQKFIFIMSESSSNYPITDKRFNGFFNWTISYKLSSHIPCPYVMVMNKKGEVVGPKIDMHWEALDDGDDVLGSLFCNKSRAATWFVSNCHAKSDRKKYVRKLNKALGLYGHRVDVFGKCGPAGKSENHTYLLNLLERYYYFYLSFENSFSEDYVTEKVLTALQHNAVPIVYGGANYSR
jgi:alpha-1,3-fucosyltransferase